MRIAIAQINTRPADLEATAQRMRAYAQRAVREGAELVLFPMAALTGPTPVGSGSQEAFLLDLSEMLMQLADELPVACMIPVVTDLEGDPLAEVMLVGEGTIVPLKFLASLRLLGGGEPSGDSHVAASRDAEVALPAIELGDLRLGVACTYEDLDDYDESDLAIDALLYFGGYPFAADDPSSVLGANLAHSRYVDDARAMGAWLVGVGSLGGYGTEVFSGSSFVIDASGELVASAAAFEEDLLIADLGSSAAQDLSYQPRPWMREGQGSSGLAPEVYDAPLHLWRALSLGLHDYLAKIDKSKVVLGLDGTLSSQVLAVLATDALGPANVGAIVCAPGDDEAIQEMLRLAHNLRIDVRRLPSRAIAASVVNPEPGAELTPLLVHGILEANLAAWADELGAVVLSSADKTVLALDRDINAVNAACLAPLGDVYRSDLLELARMRNTVSPVFPQAALTERDLIKIPGVSQEGYSIETWTAALDGILRAHIEWERDRGALISAQRWDSHLVEAVLDRYQQMEPARVGRVLYLMMSSRTLFDARVPLGLAWHDRRQEDEGDEEEEFQRLLEQLEQGIGLQDGAQDAGDIASAESGLQRTRQLHDLMGYLHDFSLGGGFRPQGFGSQRTTGAQTAQSGNDEASLAGGPDAPEQPPYGPGISQGHGELPNDWRSPFSEN